MDSRRIVVYGRVQGVGFRYYVLKVATELGLKGHVRNLPNGTVEVEAEGDLAAVETLIDYCRFGPPRAVVTKVLSVTQPIVGYEQFYVR